MAATYSSRLIFALLLTGATVQAKQVIVCGSAQVLEGTLTERDGKASFEPEWTWRPEIRVGLALALRSNFAGTDEWNRVDGGKAVLITSSANALALDSYETRATLFYANVRNAHSAALLPGGLIVAASSFSPDGAGDRLLLFDRGRSDHAIATLPLSWAHGVEWDQTRGVLWALGDRELVEIKIANKQMVVQKTFPLPSRGGHDLVLSSDASVLYLTTSTQVLVFTPKDGTFIPFSAFAGIRDVKSLSIDPHDGQIAYTQAGNGVWWTYTIKFLNPPAQLVLPEHAYKMRWFPTERYNPSRAP
jgi:hypothetical protein